MNFPFTFSLCIFVPIFVTRKRDELSTHDSDNVSIEFEAERDLICDEFVGDNEQIDRSAYLPHWLADNDLKNSETETLPAAEEQFWLDLIQKYLEPIEPSDEEKVFDQFIHFVDNNISNVFINFFERNKFEKIYVHCVTSPYLHL